MNMYRKTQLRAMVFSGLVTLASSHTGAATVTWNGPDGGIWDEATSNWKSATGDPATYADGDDVRFHSGTGTQGTVDIQSSGVSPSSFMSPSGGGGNWTFVGGDITGSTSITSTASGTTFSFNRNGSYSFTGGVYPFGTFIYSPQLAGSGSTVHLGSDGSGGGGNITFAGGTFAFNPSQPAILDNHFVIAGSPGNIAGNANAAFDSGVQMGNTLNLGGVLADYSGLTLNLDGSRMLNIQVTAGSSSDYVNFTGDVHGPTDTLTINIFGSGANAYGGFGGIGLWDVGNVHLTGNRRHKFTGDGTTFFDQVAANGGKVTVVDARLVPELSGTTGSGTLNVGFPLEILAGGTVEATTVNIVAGGILGGDGTLFANLNVSGDGTVAPGIPVGTLTVNGNLILNDTSVLDFDFSGATTGLIAVSNSLTLDGVLNASQAALGQTYPLFTYGTLAADNGLQITGLAPYLRAELDTTGGQVTLLIVPEPSTAILLGLLGITLLRRRT